MKKEKLNIKNERQDGAAHFSFFIFHF